MDFAEIGFRIIMTAFWIVLLTASIVCCLNRALWPAGVFGLVLTVGTGFLLADVYLGD